VAKPPEVALAATGTAPEAAELAATAATLRPLASTAELASATMTWLRMRFMTVPTLLGHPAHERLITLCNVDADIGILTGIYIPVNVAL
jgi:hypothetical protein